MKKMYLAAALALGMSAQAGSAAVISTLGDKDFTDGEEVMLSDFNSASAGDPAGFNQFRGDDRSGSPAFATFEFTHSFAAPLSGMASLVMNLFDVDSVGTNDVLDVFFDGIQQDDSVWLGAGAVNATMSERAMNVDLSFLADGLLNVRIVTTAGRTASAGNGFGIDYSELSVSSAPAVPLPAGGLLLLSGMGLLALRRRKTA